MNQLDIEKYYSIIKNCSILNGIAINNGFKIEIHDNGNIYLRKNQDFYIVMRQEPTGGWVRAFSKKESESNSGYTIDYINF